VMATIVGETSAQTVPDCPAALCTNVASVAGPCIIDQIGFCSAYTDAATKTCPGAHRDCNTEVACENCASGAGPCRTGANHCTSFSLANECASGTSLCGSTTPTSTATTTAGIADGCNGVGEGSWTAGRVGCSDINVDSLSGCACAAARIGRTAAGYTQTPFFRSKKCTSFRAVNGQLVQSSIETICEDQRDYTLFITVIVLLALIWLGGLFGYLYYHTAIKPRRENRMVSPEPQNAGDSQLKADANEPVVTPMTRSKPPPATHVDNDNLAESDVVLTMAAHGTAPFTTNGPATNHPTAKFPPSLPRPPMELPPYSSTRSTSSLV